MYPLPFSAVLGVEGAGVIVALGSDVGGLRVGDRVAYSGAPGGAYAAEWVIPAWRAVPSPATVPDERRRVHPGPHGLHVADRDVRVGPGTTMLVHGVTGSLGSLLAQWGTRLGAIVFLP